MQAPLHSPVHADSHCPMQLAGRCGVPSQKAEALQVPPHCTLSDPGSHRVTVEPESHTSCVLHVVSHLFCCSKSGRQTPCVHRSAKFALDADAMIGPIFAAATSQAPVWLSF